MRNRINGGAIGSSLCNHAADCYRLISAKRRQCALSNTTAAGRAKNRRVEIRILQNKGIAEKSE